MFDHISVDFDGTLFVNGNVDNELVDKINAKYNGKVFIFTSRSWGDYYLIKNILLEAGLKFESLVCGKLMCGSYLDDRNLKIDEFKKTRKIPPEHITKKSCFDCLHWNYDTDHKPSVGFPYYGKCSIGSPKQVYYTNSCKDYVLNCLKVSKND